ncbi:MAG: hypothetical protein RI953_2018 [Pseudomonadota bacterium]|jgi:hypothetical protein
MLRSLEFPTQAKGWRVVGATAMVFVALGMALIGCGKKKSGDTSPDAALTGQLALSFEAANSNTKGTSNLLGLTLRELATTPAQPDSIASGAPDSFEVNILSMDLKGADANFNIFKSDTGKSIKITGSEIDLSQLFTTYDCYKADGTPITLAAGETCKCGVDKTGKLITPQADGSCKLTNENGELIEITQPAGLLDVAARDYSTLSVTFAPKAKIKGCVSATFKTTTATTTNGSSGYQKYCTQTDKASTNESIKPGHAVFKGVTAQETEMYLSKGWDSRSNNLNIDFPIKDGLKIAAGQKSNLTMVIDVNRMLRFYNQGRSDQGPNPGFPTDRSYFFTTVFEDSLFVFAGKAGAIRGYSWQTSTCSGTFANIFTCSTPQSVDGWLTLILDDKGTPFAASAMPDDDNNWTTLKGSNRKASIGIDASMIKQNADGTYDVSVSLGNGGDPVIYKVDLSKELNSSFETDYRGLSGQFGNGTTDTFGRIKLTRGL